ncbi:MAG: ABC transporter ATP-binding protein [Gudongella sp.]|nr:ABC transporter ATP-binding protein [Gudongella sp.]
MGAIEVRNLSFKYKEGEPYILKNVNFSVKPGEILGISGKSGIGKSTLCKCICGIIPKLQKGTMTGEVFLFNENILDKQISEIVTKIGIVFQNPVTQLFSPTIEDELVFGPENLCISREEIDNRLQHTLKILDIEKFRYKNPNKLSGGEQQLIAIGAVLMMEPEIYIFDEILSFVDKEAKKRIINIIRELKKEKKTIIMVDHDIENMDIADKILYI